MVGGWLAERLILYIPLVLSLTVHEWAHARAAYALGDRTAAHLGRMSLDPLVHIDPIGTLILPLLGLPIGWARPVPVNPFQFAARWDGRVGMMLVAAAGPASNLTIAGLLWAASAAVSALGLLNPTNPAASLVEQAMTMNLALAAFNLLPVPPLDGSRVVEGLIPERFRPLWDQLGALGPALLIALGFAGLTATVWLSVFFPGGR